MLRSCHAQPAKKVRASLRQLWRAIHPIFTVLIPLLSHRKRIRIVFKDRYKRRFRQSQARQRAEHGATDIRHRRLLLLRALMAQLLVLLSR